MCANFICDIPRLSLETGALDCPWRQEPSNAPGGMSYKRVRRGDAAALAIAHASDHVQGGVPGSVRPCLRGHCARTRCSTAVPLPCQASGPLTWGKWRTAALVGHKDRESGREEEESSRDAGGIPTTQVPQEQPWAREMPTAPWVQGGPIWPRDALLLGSWWMLREIELSLARIHHLSFSRGPLGFLEVTWLLPAS